MYELAKRGDDIVGIDYLSDYNDIRLKLSRLEHCGFTDTKPFKAGSMCTSSMFSNCRFQKVDIADKTSLYRLFHDGQFDKVVHLAAQVGSRYSVVNPDSYLRNNLIGFLNIIETCRHYGVRHLVYASSSSVYGNAGTQEDKANTDPKNRIERPVSLHASIKKSNELMASARYCRAPTREPRGGTASERAPEENGQGDACHRGGGADHQEPTQLSGEKQAP